jgi:hypothetical protein
MDFVLLAFNGLQLVVQAMQIGASMKQTNQVFDSILGKDVIESAYRQPNVAPPTFDQNIANALDRMSAAATYQPPRGAPPTIPTVDPADVYRVDDNSPAPIMPRLAEPDNAIELDDVEIGFDPLPMTPRLQTPEETAKLDEVDQQEAVELDSIDIDINDLPEIVAQQEPESPAPPEVSPPAPEATQAVELDSIDIDINDLPQRVAENQSTEPTFKEPTNLNNVLPTMPEMERPASRGNHSRSDSETGGKPVVARELDSGAEVFTIKHDQQAPKVEAPEMKAPEPAPERPASRGRHSISDSETAGKPVVARELDSGAVVFTIKHQDDPKPKAHVERAVEPAPPAPQQTVRERLDARVQVILAEQAKIQAERDKQQPEMKDKAERARAINADHDAQFVSRAEALLKSIKSDTQRMKDFNAAPPPAPVAPQTVTPQVTTAAPQAPKAEGPKVDVPPPIPPKPTMPKIEVAAVEAPTVAAPPPIPPRPTMTKIEVAAPAEPKVSTSVADMISTIKPVPVSEAKAQTAGRTGMMNHPPSKMKIMLDAINKHSGGGWENGPGEGHSVQFKNKGVDAFEVKSDKMVVQDHSSDNMEAMLVGFKAAYGNDKKPSINCPPELEQKWKDVAAKLSIQIELKGPVATADHSVTNTPAAPKQEAAVEMERRGPGM